jgi:hypothetical protein
MTTNQYIPMRDIGTAVGMTSHQIGRKLKQLGLRTQDGKPTRVAFEKKLCAQRWAAHGRGYCWAWDVTRVLPLLGAPGPKLTPTPSLPPAGTTSADQSQDGSKS